MPETHRRRRVLKAAVSTGVVSALGGCFSSTAPSVKAYQVADDWVHGQSSYDIARRIVDTVSSFSVALTIVDESATEFLAKKLEQVGWSCVRGCRSAEKASPWWEVTYEAKIKDPVSVKLIMIVAVDTDWRLLGGPKATIDEARLYGLNVEGKWLLDPSDGYYNKPILYDPDNDAKRL